MMIGLTFENIYVEIFMYKYSQKSVLSSLYVVEIGLNIGYVYILYVYILSYTFYIYIHIFSEFSPLVIVQGGRD